MPFKDRLRNRILDELRSAPDKQKRYQRKDYDSDPDLLPTILQMEDDGEIKVGMRSNYGQPRFPLIILLVDRS